MISRVLLALALPGAAQAQMLSVADPIAPLAVTSPSPPLSLAWGLFEVLDGVVAPGEQRRLHFRAGESFSGSAINTPVLVARGIRPGETLCLTGGIHGDELNGIEVIRALFERIDPATLSGTVLGVPIVNMHGFRRGSRYLPDRRDLNRYFPGNPAGSSASRIARALFDGVILRCGLLVDFHTGSFHRTNVPHIRGDLTDPRVFELALGFGPTAVLHTPGVRGTLRRAATEAGVPAITFEAGEPTRIDADAVLEGVSGVLRLLESLRMVRGMPTVRGETYVYLRSHWVRVDQGGILHPERGPGDPVGVGDHLATVTDPIRNERSVVRSPYEGRILGMAVPQVVIPGFAAFNVGVTGGDPLAPNGGAEELEIDQQPE